MSTNEYQQRLDSILQPHLPDKLDRLQLEVSLIQLLDEWDQSCHVERMRRLALAEPEEAAA